MAQNEGSEGFMGTVRNYIPGLSPSQGEPQTSSGSQHGILSYIPGFGGSHVDNDTTKSNEGKATVTDHGRTDAGEVTSPNKSAVHGEKKAERIAKQSDTGAQHPGGSGTDAAKRSGDDWSSPRNTSTPTNNYSSSYQGAGIGTKYSTGKEAPHGSTQRHNNSADNRPQPYSSGEAARSAGKTADSSRSAPSRGDHSPAHDDSKTGGAGSLAHSQDQNQGSKGYTGQQQRARDDGVRGAPIEGEGVKGYAVSAPVGSGDTNVISPSGEPSGQVSGAHMQYAPEDTDTRDHTGRGTVGRTKGEGDSSFANVKRNIPWGTEHVVTKSSQSHIEHTSTTQL